MGAMRSLLDSCNKAAVERTPVPFRLSFCARCDVGHIQEPPLEVNCSCRRLEVPPPVAVQRWSYATGSSFLDSGQYGHR